MRVDGKDTRPIWLDNETASRRAPPAFGSAAPCPPAWVLHAREGFAGDCPGRGTIRIPPGALTVLTPPVWPVPPERLEGSRYEQHPATIGVRPINIRNPGSERSLLRFAAVSLGYGFSGVYWAV